MKKLICFTLLMMILIGSVPASANYAIDRQTLFLDGYSYNEIGGTDFDFDTWVMDIIMMDDMTFWYQNIKWTKDIPTTYGWQHGYIVNNNGMLTFTIPALFTEFEGYYADDGGLWIMQDGYQYKLHPVELFSMTNDYMIRQGK